MSQAGTKRGWLLIALALVVLVIGALMGRTGGGGDGTSGGESNAAGAQNGTDGGLGPKEDTAPQFATDAASMVQEFKDNESAAEAKYQGKWLEVTGAVNEVGSNLKLGGDMEVETTVNCHDVPEERLSGVSKGDPVTVHGKFLASSDEGLELEPCRLY